MPRSLIVSLLMTALIVAGLVLTVDLGAVWGYLLRADYSFLPLILILRTLPILSRTWRFSVLLECPHGVRPIYHAEAVSYLFNNLLPFRAGEIAAVALLRATLGMRSSRILSAMALDRLLDVIFLAMLLLATLPFVPEVPPMIGSSLSAIGLVSGLAVLIMILALRLRNRFSETCHRALHRFLPHKADVWRARLNEGIEGVNLLTSPVRSGIAILCTIVSWLWIVVSLQATAWAFGLHPDWTATIFATCVSVLGGAVIGTPGGLGVVHAAIVVSYGLFGLPADTALAIAVIVHAVSAVVALGIGGISLYKCGLSLDTLLHHHPKP